MKGAIEGPRGDNVLLVVEQQEQRELLLCSSEGSLFNQEEPRHLLSGRRREPVKLKSDHGG